MHVFPNFRDQDTIDELRNKIDSRIKELEEETRNLRTQRNELSPISMLPPEVFSQIARFYIATTVIGTYEPHLLLSGICHGWRKAMLCDQALWTDIRTENIDFASLLLERSGMVPISLSLRGSLHRLGYGGNLRKVLDFILTRRPAIKHISVDLEFIEQYPLPFLWSSAPNMVHCEIAGGSITDPSRPLFAGSAPRLAVLIMREVKFSWDWPLLYAVPLLQELEISGITKKPTVNQLHRIFSSMKKLQKLKLLGTNALPDPSNSSSMPVITLRHVDTLYIKGTSEECASFLKWTAFEKDVSFTIACEDQVQEDTYRILRPWLSNVWMSRGCPRLVGSLELEKEYSSCTIHAKSHTGEPHPTEVHLYWTHPIGSQDRRTIFQELRTWIFQHLPLSNCKTLETNIDLLQDDWAICTDNMKHLESLSLTDLDNVSLISESLTISDELNVPFPKLQELSQIQSSLSDEELDNFIAMLRCRKRKGRQLETVRVEGANKTRRSAVKAKGKRVAGTFELS